jgi:hypothetical protein
MAFHPVHLPADMLNIIDSTMFGILNGTSLPSGRLTATPGTGYPLIDQLFRFVIPHPWGLSVRNEDEGMRQGERDAQAWDTN